MCVLLNWPRLAQNVSIVVGFVVLYEAAKSRFLVQFLELYDVRQNVFQNLLCQNVLGARSSGTEKVRNFIFNINVWPATLFQD